jgi:dynein heavy chain, axonemal
MQLSEGRFRSEVAAGMVYVQPSLLGWKPLLDSWLNQLPALYSNQHKDMITSLCDWLLPPTLRLVLKYLAQPVKLQEQILVSTLLNLVEAQLKPVFGEEAQATSMKPSDVDAAVQNIFLFSVVWSLGGSLTGASRAEFDQQLRLYLEHKCAPSLNSLDMLMQTLGLKAASNGFA